MRLKISSLFNVSTRLGILEGTAAPVGTDVDDPALVEDIRRKYSLDSLERFDLSRNPDGYTPLLGDVIEFADMAKLAAENLTAYPDDHQLKLRNRLAEKFNISPEWMLITPGISGGLDMISRVFLAPGDRYLLPVPDYFRFDEVSARMGASPVHVRLQEGNHFQWTPDTVSEMVRSMELFSPKLIWLSNPANPTGRLVPVELLDRLAAEADERGVMLVVDEAYGEYTDAPAGPVSATRLAAARKNLIVLRTFSKLFGLPGARVGYVMCSSPEVMEALKYYRGCFATSWFSLYVAQIASVDDEFPVQVRSTVAARRIRFLEKAASLSTFTVLPSETNTLLIRRKIGSSPLWEELTSRGILTADLSRMPGLEGRGWIRASVLDDESNQRLFLALMDIDGQ